MLYGVKEHYRESIGLFGSSYERFRHVIIRFRDILWGLGASDRV